MHIFGITGGVGSGKSTVLEYLEQKFGARILLMDLVGHELMAKGAMCYQPILELFGPAVLKEDGEFDRKAIGALVFADKELLEKLNAIVHPAVKTTVIQRIEQAREEGVEFFFMESALLVEEKYDLMCEELWFVYAKEAVRRERLKSSRGYTDEKIDQMLKNQMTEDEYRAKGTFVIDNSGDFLATQLQIDEKMKQMK